MRVKESVMFMSICKVNAMTGGGNKPIMLADSKMAMSSRVRNTVSREIGIKI